VPDDHAGVDGRHSVKRNVRELLFQKVPTSCEQTRSKAGANILDGAVSDDHSRSPVRDIAARQSFARILTVESLEAVKKALFEVKRGSTLRVLTQNAISNVNLWPIQLSQFTHLIARPRISAGSSRWHRRNPDLSALAIDVDTVDDRRLLRGSKVAISRARRSNFVVHCERI
jgi:hypothetical protein